MTEWGRLLASAIIHHVRGRAADSDAALQRLIATYQNEAAYQIAQAYAARAEPDHALAWLDRACGQHDPGLNDLKTEPLFRFLHPDPRWTALLRKIGFPDELP